MANITLMGKEYITNGELPPVGSVAPEFSLTDKRLIDVGLADFLGQKKVLNIVPSFDTPVCSKSAKVFNDIALDYKDIVFLAISADLPFATSRFCSVEKVKNITFLSMMRAKNFARDYGVLIEDGPFSGLCSRAVVVIDEKNTVIHAELVKELSKEPSYESVISVLK